MDKFFLIQIKRTNGTIEKGVVVKDSLDSAKQSYHAYLGAYAYGNNENTDYVLVQIMNGSGLGLLGEVWEAPEAEPTEA